MITWKYMQVSDTRTSNITANVRHLDCTSASFVRCEKIEIKF
jgi:hypothetical protein